MVYEALGACLKHECRNGHRLTKHRVQHWIFEWPTPYGAITPLYAGTAPDAIAYKVMHAVHYYLREHLTEDNVSICAPGPARDPPIPPLLT